jgi:hypothetical protein
VEVVFASDDMLTKVESRYCWHATAGVQALHQCPDLNYDPVNTTRLKAWNDDKDISVTSISFFSLQREIGNNSSIELQYSADGKHGSIYGTARVRAGFIYFYPVVRVPLEIDIRTLALKYTHTLWQPGRISAGASFAVQAFQLSMNASLPRLFESLGGEDHFDYLVVVPKVGGIVEYSPQGSLKYKVLSEYVTVPLGDIAGDQIRIDACVDWKMSDRIFFGLGYRYSDTNIRLHEKRHEIRGSYEVHGYQLYAGWNF